MNVLLCRVGVALCIKILFDFVLFNFAAEQFKMGDSSSFSIILMQNQKLGFIFNNDFFIIP